MLGFQMSQQLISSVVLNWAKAAFVGLVLDMSPFVVSAVADGCELLLAIATVVRLLTGVCAHMYQKISFFGKNFTAVLNLALKQVLTRMS